jgi:integrase
MQDAGICNQHGALSAASGQALRWGWVSQNVVAMAQRKTSKKQPREVMPLDDVGSAIAAAAEFDPAAALALRLAATTGARRAELAALQWTDVDDGMLTIDSAMTVDPDTLNAIWALRGEREPDGPWMFGVGANLVPPNHIGRATCFGVMTTE